MAKFVATSVLQAALDKFATANLMTCTAGAPANRTEAVNLPTDNPVGKRLAQVAMAPADFTFADEPAGGGFLAGRRVDIGGKTGVTIDYSGNGDHVNLVDATELIYSVDAVQVLALEAGNTLAFQAMKYILHQVE